MFETLKKKSLKSSLLGTIAYAIIGILLTAYFSTGAWYVVTGYAAFINLKPEEISNQWVALELERNYGCFAEKTETNSSTHSTKTTGLYYVIATGDDYAVDYRFMGIRVPAKYESQMDKLMYANGSSDSLFLSGRIEEMNDSEYRYFKEYMLDAGFSEEELEEAALPYYIMVFGDETSMNVMTMIGFLLGLLFLIVAVCRIVKALTGGYLKKLKKDIASVNVSEASAESDWNSALEICKDVKVGRLFTYYIWNNKPRAIPNTKVLWAYQNTTTHRTNGIKTGTTYSVMIWIDGQKNATQVLVANEASAQSMLKRFSNMFPWMVLGYSDDLRKMFHKDRAQFLQLRYNTVDHIAVEPGFESYQ